MLKKWLHEPLLHFLFLGGLIFVLYGFLQEDAADNPARIVISQADMERMQVLWERKWQRPPTREEIANLLEQQIREEVLYREALAMGLDRNDTIVRRRLAQKVEFISADLASQAEPTDAELADYLADHSEKFTEPARISFIQLYINADKRGARALADAEKLLAELHGSSSNVDLQTAGDPLMFGHRHQDLTEYEVARLFGRDFARKLFNLPLQEWQGPIPSGYGLHLIRIDDNIEAQPPELEKVRDKVREEWLSAQRRKIDAAFYNELRKGYDIIVETPHSVDRTVSATRVH